MNEIQDAQQSPVSHASTMVGQLVHECFAPVSPGAIDRYTDSPRVRGMYAAIVEAFPDATFTPLWWVAEDDRVVLGGMTRGTHRGPWRDVPGTGRRIETLATVMLEVADQTIVDLMVVTDSLAIAEQIGAVEPLGPKACQRPVADLKTSEPDRTPCGDAMFDRLSH